MKHTLIDYRLYPSRSSFDPSRWFELMKSFFGEPVRQTSESYPDETRHFFECARVSARLLILPKENVAYLDLASHKPVKGFPFKDLKRLLGAVSYLVLELSRGNGQAEKSSSTSSQE